MDKNNDDAVNKELIEKYENEIKFFHTQILKREKENAFINEALKTADEERHKKLLQDNKAENDGYISYCLDKLNTMFMLLKVANAESSKENDLTNEDNDEDGLSQ